MPINSGLSLPMKIASLVSVLCLGVGLYFFMEANRYSIVKDGAGDLYKIDRRTGRTWKLMDVVSVEVREFAQGGKQKRLISRRFVWLRTTVRIQRVSHLWISSFKIRCAE